MELRSVRKCRSDPLSKVFGVVCGVVNSSLDLTDGGGIMSGRTV
jgi:hypothetical protein